MNQTIDPRLLLHVTERREWRAWLRKYRNSQKEIWLAFNKKHTGRYPRGFERTTSSDTAASTSITDLKDLIFNELAWSDPKRAPNVP